MKALLFAALLQESDEKAKWMYRMTLEGRRRRERRLPREALLSPDMSAWNRLFDSGTTKRYLQ
jgi:hypothetical protein